MKRQILAFAITLALATNLSAQTFTTLHSFGGSDGAYPYDGLVLSGNMLYGTVAFGGSSNNGTVFKVNTDGTGFTTLYSFTASPSFTNSDGANPFGELVLSGNVLYGTAAYGGSSGNGTIFKVNTDGTGFITLHTFTWNDGSSPYGGLVLSGDILYGTTADGGSSGNGTIFKVNIDGTGFITLHTFTWNDGSSPYGGLVLSNSTLYGTAESGGSNGPVFAGNGTVFKVNTDGTGFTTLHTFTWNDGSLPYGGLVLSGDILYGTTADGGSSGNGTIFKVNTDGTDFTILHSFTNSDGASPWGGLVLSGNILYGMASGGGSSGYGTIFKINTDGTGFSNLYSFSTLNNETNSDGAYPVAGLILSGNILYGIASGGGSSGYGTVFALSLIPSAPIITAQPQSQTVQTGTNVSFTVTASEFPPPIYQWQFNGVPIAGTTNASLIITNVQFADAGGYSVIVANTYGSVTSTIAQLTVSQPLLLTQTSLTPTTDESTPTVLGLCPISPTQLKVFVNGSFTTAGALDSSKMTIVLTHGWIPTLGTKKLTDGINGWPLDFAKALAAKGIDANIVGWDWSCAAQSFACDPSKAAGNTQSQGIGLAQALSAALGGNYAQPIHFIGHSLGTLVNASAANYLLAGGFDSSRIQMTLLDEASIATFTDCLSLPWLAAVGSPSSSPNYLQPLPRQFKWADNYISLVGNLQPTAANVILTNGLPASASGVLDLIDQAENFHGYPCSWFYATIADDISVMGDHWSFERGGFSGAPATNTYHIQNGSGWNLVETTHDNAASVANSRWQTYHNAVNITGAQTVESGFGSGNVFGLSTWGAPTDANIILYLITSLSGGSLSPQSSPRPLDGGSEGTGNTNVPAYAWIPVTIPSNAISMSFDFLLDGNGQNDSLAVALNGTNVLSVELSLVQTNVTLNSGPINVSEYAGQQVELFVGVVGGTSTNASVTVSNLQFYVELPPTLQAQVANNNFAVSWPLLAQNFNLQTTTNLADPNSWVTLTNVPAIVNLQNVITNPISDGMRFYRLKE